MRAGTVAVLEVARLLKKAGTPRRTIIFANMTGEEIGLVGTNWFIAHPPFPLTRIVAGFEIEMIGRPDSLAGGPGKAWLTGYERSTMGDMLKQYGIAIVPDMRPDQRFFTRSDNYGLAQRGIVAHTLSTFNLHDDYHQRIGRGQQGRLRSHDRRDSLRGGSGPPSCRWSQAAMAPGLQSGGTGGRPGNLCRRLRPVTRARCAPLS